MKTTLIKNKILGYGVAFIAIFVPAFLFNKWLEGIIFYFFHWFIRYQFDKQYHEVMPARCRLVTFCIFFISMFIIPPISLSFFSTVILCYIIGAVGCLIAQKKELQVQYNTLEETILEPKPFNTDTCTKSELISRCQELRFSAENIQLAVDFFIDKTKQSIIADRLSIDELSVKQRKQRMKKKLNK